MFINDQKRYAKTYFSEICFFFFFSLFFKANVNKKYLSMATGNTGRHATGQIGPITHWKDVQIVCESFRTELAYGGS